MVAIRPATAGDVERIGEIMHGEPGPEALALLGSVKRARRFGAGLVRIDRIPNPDKPTVVAQIDDHVVGVLQYSRGIGGTKISVAHVWLAISVLGPIGAVRMLPRLRARSRVDMAIPSSFYVAEIHVDPSRRGEGIGSQLLDWAEDEARRLNEKLMSLTTTILNPARHLYERKGFTVTHTATDPEYERYTQIPGRVLMEKRLDP